MSCYDPSRCRHLSNCSLPRLNGGVVSCEPHEHRLSLLDVFFVSNIDNETTCHGITCCGIVPCGPIGPMMTPPPPPPPYWFQGENKSWLTDSSYWVPCMIGGFVLLFVFVVMMWLVRRKRKDLL